MRKRLFAILVLVLVSATVAWAHPPGPHFRIDVSKAANGSVDGHVTNVLGYGANHVELAVEGLDGSGKVVGTNVAQISWVPPMSAAYFSAAPISGAVSYRARVTSFECNAF